MHSGVLADTGQLIGVLLILAGAVGYLTIYYHRKFKGGSDAGCGSCGIPLRRAQEKDAGAAAKPKPFVHAEDLADLAARRKAEQACRSDQPGGSGSCGCSNAEEESRDPAPPDRPNQS